MDEFGWNSISCLWLKRDGSVAPSTAVQCPPCFCIFTGYRRISACSETGSPDCLGNSAACVFNESGQRLEQLNRRDNQSLIQTAMQNMQAIASENVLSGILDFKLQLINLERGASGRVWWDLDRSKRNTRVSLMIFRKTATCEPSKETVMRVNCGLRNEHA